LRNVQRREETSQGILDAAAQLFAEKGYDATGVAEICDRAGVSKGAFYYHFSSKQTVFLEVVDRWLQGLESSLDADALADRPVAERLLAMSLTFRRILTSQSEQMALILEFWTQASREEIVRGAVIAPYRRFQHFFEGLIDEGVRGGDLGPIDPKVGAQVLLSLASGLFFQGLLDPQGSDWDNIAVQSIQLLLDGLGRWR
jgi:AcrR family transcriptional regulator